MRAKFVSPTAQINAVICSLFFFMAIRNASAGPIYVYKEKDGTVRFTTKPPSSGVSAKVFTAKRGGFSYYHGMRGRSSRIFPHSYNAIIQSACKLHAVDESLVKAVIHTESGFNPRAVSPKGALGLMQLMPSTARLYGVKRPFDPIDNVSAGVKHLALLLQKYDGNLTFTLAAYNAGEEAVRKFAGVPPYRETQEYIRRVLHLKSRYAKSESG